MAAQPLNEFLRQDLAKVGLWFRAQDSVSTQGPNLRIDYAGDHRITDEGNVASVTSGQCSSGGDQEAPAFERHLAIAQASTLLTS
jgi:hypothetical protein